MNTTYIKHSALLFCYLLVVWGFYRLLFQVPDPFDEGLVKPLIWLLPVYFLLKKEKKNWLSVGITSKNLFPAIYLSLALGMFFALEAIFINFVKYKGLNFSAEVTNGAFVGALVLSLITAVSEEITFRGYLFDRVAKGIGNVFRANIIISVAWVLIHVPIALLDWKLSFGPLIIYFSLLFIFSLGSTYVYARTQNILSSIILHVLWAWPVILFR